MTDFITRFTEGWNDPAALDMRLREAKSKGLLDDLVPHGPDEVPTRIEDALNARIKELTAATDYAEGSAA